LFNQIDPRSTLMGLIFYLYVRGHNIDIRIPLAKWTRTLYIISCWVEPHSDFQQSVFKCDLYFFVYEINTCIIRIYFNELNGSQSNHFFERAAVAELPIRSAVWSSIEPRTVFNNCLRFSRYQWKDLHRDTT